jgi:ribosomal protein L11 methyltransferase
MNYQHFTITAEPERRDIALAFLSELPFDTFEETEHGLQAYLRDEACTEELLEQLDRLVKRLGLHYEREEVPYQNWNKTWEDSFEPIQVGGFCGVRATFHTPLPGVEHEIIIDPEMAFGTGHHATTYMMIEAMQHTTAAGKRVFDYGCGTGILAILAAQMGAALVDALDIEPAAYERTLANAERNKVSGVNAYLGTLSTVPSRAYDLILANINRNVILESLKTLHDRLEADGSLLVSGILITDQDRVVREAAQAGFSLQNSAQKGDWCCLEFLVS